MAGPTATPTPVFDQYTELLLRRVALQAELQARPNDRELLDQLAAVEAQLWQVQGQVAAGAGPGAAPPAPTPAPVGPGTPAGGEGLFAGLTAEQYQQLMAPTLDVQRGQLDLSRQQFAYKQWQDAQDRIRQQTQDAWGMFMDRLRYGGGGGASAGVSYGQALPYLVAPGTEIVPGFEPGGPVEMLYRRYGLQYDPNQWRTAQVPLAGGTATVVPPALPSWAP